MNLLVFAHVPPPLHGQSAMVAALVAGLRNDAGIRVLHVDARLSRDGAEIGGWHPRKLLLLLGYCVRALWMRCRVKGCTFYYVPAPGKRGAFLRDLIVMALCRPWFDRLVLHWHAVGLGNWLDRQATPVERWLARWLLGRADLAIVLAPALAADASGLRPRRVAIVPNGIPPPPPAGAPPAPRGGGAPCRVLFLGTCSRAKGVFATLEGVALAAAANPGAYELTVAGGFEDDATRQAFARRTAELPAGLVRHVGVAGADLKHALFQAADVFCFPTAYPHEGQPLTLIEAMAHDVPIVTTRWRAIPDLLPPGPVWYVEPDDAAGIARALAAAAEAGRRDGTLRRHFLAHYTTERHLAALKAALLEPAVDRG